MTHPYRTHTCDALRKEDVGQTVRLSGWVYRKRDQKHHVFIDLRDHYGVTQLAFTEDCAEALEVARAVRPESVIVIDGEVVPRGEANPKLATGDVEIRVTAAKIDSPCGELKIPVQIPKNQSDLDDEEGRLTWRFLDLRRERIHRNIVLRDRIIRHMRDHMHSEGFVEVQTPILTNSSPEGARDYLVPSRVHPGQFFALPQAPQQWKQLLMASGFDKYFQIAPCFRDEDARADRAPGEFYQLDMEMAYVTQDDIFGVIERMYKALPDVVEVPGKPKKTIAEYPFPRIPYWESIDRFGSDKPDMRYDLELKDVSEVFKDTEFVLFKKALDAGGHVKAIRIPEGAKDGKGYVRKLEKHVKSLGYGGLPHVIIKGDALDGSIKKNVTEAEGAALRELLGCGDTDLICFGFGTRLAAAKVLGEVRLKVAGDRDLADPYVMSSSFIVDYPFYVLDDDGKVQFSHNPFSMPQGGLEALESQDPLEIKAWQYDICCNGVELSSGAIRNHRPDVMYKAFEIAGYTRSQVDTEFGHMINAFNYGAPPHGGMAPGVDRTIMLFLDEPNIREVVAFPKNQKCQDMFAKSPSYVRGEQLDELHLEIKIDPAVVKRCPCCGTEFSDEIQPLVLDVDAYRRVCCTSCKGSCES
jgi:aspartyl-tRNA synthetase